MNTQAHPIDSVTCAAELDDAQAAYKQRLVVALHRRGGPWRMRTLRWVGRRIWHRIPAEVLDELIKHAVIALRIHGVLNRPVESVDVIDTGEPVPCPEFDRLIQRIKSGDVVDSEGRPLRSCPEGQPR